MRKKYYEDPKENAAFERCVDVMTELILKYGPSLKRRWALEKLMANVWLDIVFTKVTMKRLSGYHRLSKDYRRQYKNSDQHDEIGLTGWWHLHILLS